MTARLQFSDSIYEDIVFSKTLPSKLGYLSQPRGFNSVQVLQTTEFARLSFIRRHGLAWLVYPAATQTQLEYSIGHWGLARLAELLIQVKTSNTRSQPLTRWLKDAQLRAEFYLSLLCEGLGTAPLAAALEIEGPSSDLLGARDFASSKNRAAALVADYGLEKTWHRIARDRYGSTNTLGRLLKANLPVEESVCVPAVCFLLSNHQEYLDGCTHSHKQQLGFVRELIQGLLFLRGLDHYARDSYVSTMRQFGKNLRGFLQNIVLIPNSRGDGISASSINEGAVDYAAGLLLKRKYRFASKNHAADVIALHEMVHWSMLAHCRNLSEGTPKGLRTKIVFMEDDQLMELLAASNNRACRHMVRRIRDANPYALIGKWETSENVKRVVEMVTERVEASREDNIALPELLVRHVIAKGSEADNCFALGNIRIGHEGASLAEHAKYKKNVAHIESVVNQGGLYFFSRERGNERLKVEIKALLSH